MTPGRCRRYSNDRALLNYRVRQEGFFFFCLRGSGGGGGRWEFLILRPTGQDLRDLKYISDIKSTTTAPTHVPRQYGNNNDDGDNNIIITTIIDIRTGRRRL